jgi:hypothetical protein
MNCSKLWTRVVLSAFVAIFPASGFADTYQIINLGDAGSNSVYGIDTAGDVVIQGATGCGDLFYCYKTYVDGVESAVSATAPIMDYDDGTSCQPTAQAGKGACNDGYEVFGVGPEVFAGLDGVAAFFASGSVDAVVMNSVGDFAWTDGIDEFNYEAIDLTPKPVPEPGSLALLLTGALGGVATLRRRLAR